MHFRTKNRATVLYFPCKNRFTKIGFCFIIITIYGYTTSNFWSGASAGNSTVWRNFYANQRKWKIIAVRIACVFKVKQFSYSTFSKMILKRIGKLLLDLFSLACLNLDRVPLISSSNVLFTKQHQCGLLNPERNHSSNNPDLVKISQK